MSDFKFVLPPGVAGTLAGTPVADFMIGNTVSDVVSMEDYREAYFLVILGDATGGTATPTITIIPSSTAAKTATTTAIPFQYKRISATETETAWVTASTLTCTAGDNQLYVVKVNAANLPDGYPYVYMNIVETVDDPVLGGLVIMMANPRYNAADLETVTA